MMQAQLLNNPQLVNSGQALQINQPGHTSSQAANAYPTLTIHSGPAAASFHVPGMIPVAGPAQAPRGGSGPLYSASGPVYSEIGMSSSAAAGAQVPVVLQQGGVMQQGGMMHRPFVSRHSSLTGPGFTALTQAAAGQSLYNTRYTRFQQAGLQPMYVQQAAAIAAGRGASLGSHPDSDLGLDSPAAVQRALAAASALLNRHTSLPHHRSSMTAGIGAISAAGMSAISAGGGHYQGPCSRGSLESCSYSPGPGAAPVAASGGRLLGAAMGVNTVEGRGQEEREKEDGAGVDDGQDGVVTHSRHKLYKTDVCRNWLQTGTCK